MNTRERGITVSTVGYMFVAISGWMLFMSAAGWYTNTIGATFLLPMAIVLSIISILAFVADRALDGVVFFGAAAILGSIFGYESLVVTTHVAQPITYIGWFACMWFVYYGCTWLGSFRSGMARTGFLTCLSLSFLLFAIGSWVRGAGWEMAGGYLGLIASCFAFAVAGTEIVRKGRMANPNLEVPVTPSIQPGQTSTGATRPMAAD